MKTEPIHPPARRHLALRLAIASTALVMVFLASALGGYYFWYVDQKQQELDEQILAETGELLGVHAQNGGEELARAILERLSLEADGDLEDTTHFYLYIESDTRISVGNVEDWPVGLDEKSDPQTLLLNTRSSQEAATVLKQKARVRVEYLDQGGRLLVGHNLQSNRDRERALRFSLFLGGVAALLTAVTTGLLMSRSLLKRMEVMNHTVLRILAGDRQERVPYRTPGDEFDELAHHFDEMLNENESLVAGMRSVTDDIAHDLRTPLARVQQQVDVALAGEGDVEHLRAALARVRVDTTAVLDTFQELLLIAKVESGQARERMEILDLSKVVTDAVEFYQPVADEVGLKLEVSTTPSLVNGNTHLLAQLCTNLLDNAIKYTPAPGKISVCVKEGMGCVHLSIADSGPGIPLQEYEHVLERFVRLDRSRSQPGTGLGLSFVKAVANLHQATLQFHDGKPGLKVSLDFPQCSG